MKRLQHVAGMVRSLRNDSKQHSSAKVTIEKVMIAVDDSEFKDDIKEIERYLIEEINCFDVDYDTLEGKVSYKAIPIAPVIGRTYKKLAKDIIKEIEKIESDTIKMYNNGNIDNLIVNIGDQSYEIDRDAVSIGIEINNQYGEDILIKINSGVMVIINFEYTDRVHRNYMKTLFIRNVQDMRKKTDLHPWNKIGIYYDTDSPELGSILKEFRDEISDSLIYEINHISKKKSHEKNIIRKDCLVGKEKIHITITDMTGEFIANRR